MKKAIIIGAGPAGLTAAYELLTRTGIRPVVLEKSEYLGGISRTVNYKGNRIDIGGHRFFSKSDRVMDWWLKMLPMESNGNGSGFIHYHGMETPLPPGAPPASPKDPDRVMLVRPRRSRIYYLRRFFDYPVSLSRDTLRKLGIRRTSKIVASYARSALFPIKQEDNLEQFFINRFGKQLYLTFFKAYTEKVWGVPCHEISAAWGAQRIKGLSMWGSVRHAIRKRSGNGHASQGVHQKRTETSLIEQFLYPKFGPGQMWEEVASRICELGGEIHTGYCIDRLLAQESAVRAVEAVNVATGDRRTFEGDYFFSSAPVKELVHSFEPPAPANVQEVAGGLVYRDFLTVGLLVRGLRIHEETPEGRTLIRDNWIYVQEPDVGVARLQIFNNWSPYLVADPTKVWLGLEYFCNETGELWRMPDDEIIALATRELSQIGILEAGAVLDATVLRMEKTYPAYFGTYNRFPEIREFVDGFENLFLIGRNGMHRYNNQDHSMLTAMMAVDQIAAGRIDKSQIWRVNTETEYHEEKDEARYD